MRNAALFLFLLFCFFLKAQPPEKFYTTFGGQGVDIGYGLKETFQRQYVIVGSTTSFGAGSSDVYLFVADSMGQPVWQKTFGGAGADVGKNLVVNPSDSGFVIAGFTSSFGGGGYDVYVIRTDKNGNMKWQSTFGGFDWDFGNDIAFSADGNVLVCGKTFSYGYGKSDGYVIKIDINNGVKIWEKFYGGPEEDEFSSVILANNANMYLSGTTGSYGDVNGDFWLFKPGNNGDSLSSQKFGVPNRKEYCYDFMQDNSGNFVLCGALDTSVANVGKNVAYILKSDLNGNFLSDIQYGSGAGPNDRLLAVTRQKSGNDYCFSRSVYKPGFDMESQPFLLDASLIYKASTTYIAGKDEETFDIIYTKDNGFALVGYSKSFSAASEDVFFLKIDSTLFNSTQVVGIETHKKEKRVRAIWSDGSHIYFENPESNNLSFAIYSVDGKCIERSKTNKRSIDINPELEKGIYFVMIENTGSLKFIKE